MTKKQLIEKSIAYRNSEAIKKLVNKEAEMATPYERPVLPVFTKQTLSKKERKSVGWRNFCRLVKELRV